MKLNVKVKAGQTGDYHRFFLSGSPGPSFEDLRRKVAGIAQATFGVPDGPEVEYKITYQDDEDDPCVMATQEDLETAISFLSDPASPLRLTVQHVSPVARPAAAHGPRWHAVRGEQGWHTWAVGKFGPMPARRLAAAWSISPGAAVKKIIAAMEGSPEALKAIETVLCRDDSTPQDKQPADGEAPPFPPPHCHEDPWHPHEVHPWMHHMLMMKGKGCLKGKGFKGMMKGKAKGWHHPDWHHDPASHAELHHKGKGMGMKGKGCHGGAHCRGRGGPAHKIAVALGIDKHEAWDLIEAAAGGDAAAQEKIATAFPDAEQAKQLDAAWVEAKLAKKAEKMACKSELLEAKAAWFASSDKKKHQVKAAKLQQKAAAVQSKGNHFHKLAAGFQAQGTVQNDAGSVASPLEPPTPVENTIGQGGATDFVETFTVVDPNVEEPNVDQDAAEVNNQVDDLTVEVPSVPLEWAGALESMTTMGFESAQAAQALQDHNGNLQLAVSQLIGGIPPH